MRKIERYSFKQYLGHMGFRKNWKQRIYSGDNLMNLSDVRYLPRWVILSIDIFFVSCAIFFSCYLIEKLSFSSRPVFFHRTKVYLMIVGISVFFMYVFRTYSGIIRHSTFIDLFKLFLATFCTTVVMGFISFTYYFFTGERMSWGISSSEVFLTIFPMNVRRR